MNRLVQKSQRHIFIFSPDMLPEWNVQGTAGDIHKRCFPPFFLLPEMSLHRKARFCDTPCNGNGMLPHPKEKCMRFHRKMRELPASADKMERSGKPPPELPAFTGIQQTVPEYFMFDGQRNGRNHPLTGGISGIPTPGDGYVSACVAYGGGSNPLYFRYAEQTSPC